ncbi:polysaccharide pyruvyl transferase family protein [Paenibacillus sp. URB8-2]|uniref:polysaccharide pyruvyl transferase family protein n=1 Tax=Paenibacillus sp. URB8-2 TaxID=2741301 RepID=UPI0015C0A4C5|nr:polysaccharide pyruvyl transferase family protein [Paenibacillus sp. URB8-2]BCG60544.1 putative pyruvyl transferase EpsI [Paenibacillus sp. URB8-2]
MKTLKKLVPLKMKISIRDFVNYYTGYSKNKGKYNLKGKKIFVVGTPEHDNLGDHAIVLAEIKLLEKYFSEYEILEVLTVDFFQNLRCLKKFANKEDIFVLQGGGNFGIEYFREEKIRREIITKFPNNKMILFPQTIFFSDTEQGKSEFKKSQEIYKKHKHLTLVAREQISYDIMKEGFGNNKVLLTPDIVMFLEMSYPYKKRNGALLCIRNDKESALTEIDKQIIQKCSKIYEQVIYTDTCVHHNVSVEDREEELNKLWNQFRESKIVITDRLHGMIFAAITSTPCIALGNYNYKVEGSYNWIKHLEYIKYTNSVEKIPGLIEELKKIDPSEYNNSFSLDYYEKIVESMKASRDSM